MLNELPIARYALRYRFVAHIPLVAVLVFMMYYVTFEPRAHHALVVGLGIVGSLYALLLSVLTGVSRVNFVFVYGLYLSLSHLGLLGSSLIVSGSFEAFTEANEIHPIALTWYYQGDRTYAAAIAAIGICSFFLGASIVSRSKRPSALSLQSAGDSRLRKLGSVCLSIGGVYLVMCFATRRLPLFATYANFVEAIGNLPSYPYYLLGFSAGMTMTCAVGTAAHLRRAMILVGLQATLLLMTGNRGEVMYAAAASAAILSRRGLRLNARMILLGFGAFFLLIPVVRSFRREGADSDFAQILNVSLTDPFIELGYQIRPVLHVIDWIRGGEEHAYGGSYLLPIERIVGSVLPFVERPDLVGNPYYFGERLPGQGFSVIAEAYYNFGPIGQAGVLALLGCFFGYAGRSTSSRALATMGVVSAILINNQRNAFLFVPGQALIALLMIVGALTLMRRDIGGGKI